jgi:hypothetical protein
MIVEYINCKLICFGLNGVAILTSVHGGATTQMCKGISPNFMFFIHYLPHRTNLVVQNFLNIP